jgi:GNAT superfamily N-acetyltransferase
MPHPTILVTDIVDRAAEEAIGGGLKKFNEEQSGISDALPLAVILKDPDGGETLGGAIGRTSLGLLFLDLFFLPQTLRGAGLGTQILRMFEDEGRRRGCRSAMLYTISFQAPEFYARNGWQRFGEIPRDPPGTSRIFMTKSL